tara:strand:+ start:3321 stop:3581 length:261 start_codon:yes stop_codon:yes gene_type:complete
MVDGTKIVEVLEAASKPDPFTVCFGDFCYDVPGWGSPYLLALGVLEIIWWLFLSAWVGRRLKRYVLRRKAKRDRNVEADRSYNDPY